MKAKMKKYEKTFFAMLFLTVLVIALGSAISRAPIATEHVQTVADAIAEDGIALSDLTVSQNYFVEPLTDANYLAVAAANDSRDLNAEVLSLMSNDLNTDAGLSEDGEEVSQGTDYYIETLEAFKEFQAISKENSFVHLFT